MVKGKKAIEINKMTKYDFVRKISEIFSIESSYISYKDIDNTYFDINFQYKDFLIHVYTNTDNFHRDYQDIEVKKISTELNFEWTPFYMMLAYYDDSTFDMRINFSYLLSCLVKLKQYLDQGKAFFEYYNKDLSERYFILENEIKRLPILIDVVNDTELMFGKSSERIELHKAKLYK